MNTNENLNPERSLEIISVMIEKTRRNVARSSGTPMVVWGCLTTNTAAAVGILWTLTGSPAWNLLWLAMMQITEYFFHFYLICIINCLVFAASSNI